MLSRSSIALFERYCQNQIFEGVHFEMQIGGPKRCPFKWKHWFLVSERSELSKNVYIYNSPKNMNERFFLDIATLNRRAAAAKATADKEASQNTKPTCTFHDCEHWKYDRKE